MGRRWLTISEFRKQAQRMPATEFELMFPHPVLVAAIVRGGQLIRTHDANATMGFVDPRSDAGGDGHFIPQLSFMPIRMPPRDQEEPWVTIGRTTASDVVINDYTVSKDHGRMLIRPGRYQLEDTRSRNGTWIEDAQLRPFRPHPLHSGQLVRFGRQTFTFFDVTGFRRFILDEPEDMVT